MKYSDREIKMHRKKVLNRLAVGSLLLVAPLTATAADTRKEEHSVGFEEGQTQQAQANLKQLTSQLESVDSWAEEQRIKHQQERAIARAKKTRESLLEIPRLVQKAEEAGVIDVFVVYDVAVQPKSKMLNAEAIERQNSRVMEAQERGFDKVKNTRAKLVRNYRHTPTTYMEVDADALRILSQDSSVKSIELIPEYELSLATTIPIIGADVTRYDGDDGSGFTIAVIDAGIEQSDFGSRIVSNLAACFAANGTCPGGTTERFGAAALSTCSVFPACHHGNHVTDIAAGTLGVARNANIVPIRIVQSNGTINGGDVLAAYEHVIDNAAQIDAVNMSYGTPPAVTPCTIASEQPLFVEMLNADITLVAASGNSFSTGGLGSPACQREVISVGASTNSDQVAPFSNSAPAGPDLLAPGVGTPVPQGQQPGVIAKAVGAGTVRIQGTSQASPHVAGSALAILEAVPSASTNQIKDALQSTGTTVNDTRNGINRPYPRIRTDLAVDTLEQPRRILSAVLPASRSIQVGSSATAFATIINTSNTTAQNCSIGVPAIANAGFSYQETNPATNQLIGQVNTPVNIAAGGSASFVFTITPNSVVEPTTLEPWFDCTDEIGADAIFGLNTLTFSASTNPTIDIIALAATATNDGILHLPGSSGSGAFSIATTNAGVAGNVIVKPTTGASSLPLSLTICQTNPNNGACLSPPSASVTASIAANATPTFSVFATASGSIPLDPATRRIFVEFTQTGTGDLKGLTSVAVKTQ